MALVRSKNTRPELALRRAIFSRGIRYRLHPANLPGKPDLVLPRFRAVILINGCFWHWHGCARSRMPVSNIEYWTQKIQRNQERDRIHYAALRAQGWRILIVWECALQKKWIDTAAILAVSWLKKETSLLATIEPKHNILNMSEK